MVGIGILSKEDTVSYAITGPAGRASGFKCDLRKYHPYACYDQVEFKELIREECDAYARYLNRLDEIEESLHIIKQLIDKIPEGEYLAKTKAIIKLPEGEYYQRVEAARGEFGVFIESRGDKFPYRLKFRSPSMALVSAMPLICKEEKLYELSGTGGSMDCESPEFDC